MSLAKINNFANDDTDILAVQTTVDALYNNSYSLTEYDSTTVPAIAAGSKIDVNGSLYRAATEEAISTTDPVTSSTVADGTVYICMIPSGDASTCTAAFTATAPTWSDSKQGWYGTGGQANYKYIGMCLKSTSSYTKKSITSRQFIGDLYYKKIITTNTTWTCPISKYYTIEMLGSGGAGSSSYCGGGGSGAYGIIRKYITKGAVWTSVTNAGSGGNTTFSDGTTTLTVQNGTTASSSRNTGGAGGSTPTGFDEGYGGQPGEGVVYDGTNTYGGSGGRSFYAGGGAGATTTANGSSGGVGAGGGGAVSGAGGAGGSAMIKITG